MTTPVAFLVFNRPDCTARTLAAIREARPPRLLVVADGPRPHRPEDQEKCAAVRRLIADGVDWPCEVEHDYAEQNLGCATRVASGLTWAFSRAERLVVIEDDCLPDPSFFWFCDELLEKYADDTRIGQICGGPRYFDEIVRSTSYIFSRYGPIWGWASWRRAWSSYDLRLSSWPRLRASGGLKAVICDEAEYNLRAALYDRLYSQPPGTWDYQWGYAKLSQGMLSIIPCRNLIENIGFGLGGTHTTDSETVGLRRLKLEAPLIHPAFVLPDAEFDRTYAAEFKKESLLPLWRRAVRKFRRMTAGQKAAAL